MKELRSPLEMIGIEARVGEPFLLEGKVEPFIPLTGRKDSAKLDTDDPVSLGAQAAVFDFLDPADDVMLRLLFSSRLCECSHAYAPSFCLIRLLRV